MTASIAPHRGAGPITTSVLFTGRSLRHSIRDGEGLLMAMLQPILLMLLFTVVFGGAIMGRGDYLGYVVPGIILLCAGFGASSVAVGVANDVASGAFDRFRTLPVAAATALVGHAVASLVRNLVATAVVIAIAIAIGFRPTGGPLEWLAAIGVIALYILAITLVFACIGLVSGSPEAANGAGFILLFLPYLSSAFVPLDTLPDWLRPIAEHQPVTPVIETVRGLLTTADTASWPIALAWILGIIVVGSVLLAVAVSRPRSRR